jgi:sugar phosphate isomerase/epimerase
MTQLTILNDIVHDDLEQSLNIQQSWQIQTVDLRNINGKNIIKLSNEEAEQALQAVTRRGMDVYCLSFGLFFDDIEKGEAHFRQNHLGQVARAIEVARIFNPKVVRLLSAHSTKRDSFVNSMVYMRENHPWVIPMYREAIDLIAAAGFQVTIENEVHGNILTNAEEILQFFQELNRSATNTFTFDVQNLWLMGTFPTMAIYQQLAPLIGYYHLKGGMGDDSGGVRLKWKSTLEDASWPVLEMTRKVVEDGRCGAICLNPSHGEDYSNMNQANADFLRRAVPELK